MTRQEKRDHWEKVIEDYRKSGLSQAKYAQQNSISLNTLRYWLKRFPAVSQVELLPVLTSKALGPVTLELPKGVLLHFSQHISPTLLAEFVSTFVQRV